MTALTQTSPLGDKTVRRIGFGAMQLADPSVTWPPKDPETTLIYADYAPAENEAEIVNAAFAGGASIICPSI